MKRLTCRTTDDKKSADYRRKWQKALDSFNKARFESAFSQSTKVKGQAKVLLEYLVKVFVDENGKYLKDHTGIPFRKDMLGLMQLHRQEAICRFQAQSVRGAYCPGCEYHSDNNAAINNHIRAHYRLGLICGYPGCYQVRVDGQHMWQHAKEEHGIESFPKSSHQ